MQSNEPPLFTQTSFSLQGSLPVMHSLISNVQKKANELNCQKDFTNCKRQKTVVLHMVSSYFDPLKLNNALRHDLFGTLH